MDLFLVTDTQAMLLPQPARPMPMLGGAFLWLDCTHDEVAADPNAWRDAVEQITGIRLYDPHLSDAVNLRHPSYFESTQDYAMLVFRKLAPESSAIKIVNAEKNGSISNEPIARKQRLGATLASNAAGTHAALAECHGRPIPRFAAAADFADRPLATRAAQSAPPIQRLDGLARYVYRIA